jgi:hypothetical protein
MWVPGVTKDTWYDDEEYYFAQCVQIAGTPQSGIVEVAADQGVNVYVDDKWVQWVTGANRVTTLDVSAYLETGENCIILWAVNRNGCGNCRYEDNPAGVLARVRLTYMP